MQHMFLKNAIINSSSLPSLVVWGNLTGFHFLVHFVFYHILCLREGLAVLTVQ